VAATRCGRLSLRRNTLYNLLGSLAPVAVALVTIPLLLTRVGEARFGILALVWLILGHFAVFDFGLSRATANRIAKAPRADLAATRSVFWTSLWINLGCGVLGALVLFMTAEPMLVHFFHVSDATRVEALGAMPWIAAAVPLATLAGVLAGALEGRERFDVVNAMQGFGAVITQAAPLAAAYAISTEVDTLIAASVLGRVLSVALLLLANLRLVAPGMPAAPARQHARELFGYGAWISVSALIVPFFITLDKFVVAAVLGAAAVAYYSVPDQVVRRVSTFPVAITRSIFPRLSMSAQADSRELSERAARVVVCLVTPIVAGLAAAMYPFLAVWIDPDFAARARVPGVILAAGIWLNSAAMIPSIYLQASGRPDATAKCHLIEIVPHVLVLWLCVRAFGAAGAAAAMVFVTALDAFLLMRYARMSFWRANYFWQGALWIAGACAFGLWSSAVSLTSVGGAVAIAAGAAVWAAATGPELRAVAGAVFGRLNLQRGR
jgi:O-antigen/teichoic acid export membrane protein